MREGTGDQGSADRALNERRAKGEPRAVYAHSCAGSGRERIPGPLGGASAVAGSWGVEGGARTDRDRAPCPLPSCIPDWSNG